MIFQVSWPRRTLKANFSSFFFLPFRFFQFFLYVALIAIHTKCNPFRYFGYLPISCVCCSCSFDQRRRHILFEAREAHRPLGAPMVTLTAPMAPRAPRGPMGNCAQHARWAKCEKSKYRDINSA